MYPSSGDYPIDHHSLEHDMRERKPHLAKNGIAGYKEEEAVYTLLYHKNKIRYILIHRRQFILGLVVLSSISCNAFKPYFTLL